MLHVPADYEIVIKPTKGWFKLNLADVWRYRDLLGLLVHRDFVAKYKQTVLGPLWFIIQPLLMTVVFTIIFGKVAQIPTDGLPPMLFYLCGLLGWNYFATTFQATSGALTGNANLFGKVYFPRLVVPLSMVISGFIAFGIQLPHSWLSGLTSNFSLRQVPRSISGGICYGSRWSWCRLPCSVWVSAFG
jgi:lipopolysaccharide transport system permease protein